MSGFDRDRVRGFAAFPPQRKGFGSQTSPHGGRSRFARSWWGNAWIRAMEDTALDLGLLQLGRRYARSGHVGPITVSPGRIAAPVHGSDHTPHHTVVAVDQLTGAQWDRFLDQVAAKPTHIAALLDQDMPPDLVDGAADADVPLLPGAGDLEPECDCPEWGHPCKHAAALCYQAAWLLDADPFLLLLMRGRGQRELIDELQRRTARRIEPAGPTEPDSPVAARPAAASRSARDASAREVAPLPAPPPAPTSPVAAADVLLAAPATSDVDLDALRLLVADAAVRAAELLTARPGEPPPTLDRWQDTARLAATHHDADLFARLARASGRPPDELGRAARAWAYGGAAGLAVLAEPWDPPQEVMAYAVAELADDDPPADPEPQARSSHNQVTVADRGLQLRYGRDGRWYPYRLEHGQWWPASAPRAEPAAAFAELVAG